ncbi:MAG: IS1 family transposase [Terriglobales bacterium]
MYTLSTDKKLAVISGLVEGNSIRSISRMTNVDRNTINSLLLRTGDRCAALLGERMRQLPCRRLQCDEIWTYVAKKERHVREDDPEEFGSQWVYVALDADTKLIPAYYVGKRCSENTQVFMQDVYQRIADHRIQLTTDAYIFYRKAVEESFGGDADYAQLKKLFGDYGQHGNERYSPSPITEVISRTISGVPDPAHVSTSYVERQNLTIRMQMRRFTRLTNAFSKKLTHLKAACALHFAHYNFCRVHSSLRVTPAMAAGLSSDVWPLERLLA